MGLVLPASALGAEAVADPSFSPPSGAVVPVSVRISCATPEAVIRYTLDGSVPTLTSPVVYTNLVFTNLTLLRARAFKAGLDPSGTVFAYYVEPLARTDMGYYRTVTNDAGHTLPRIAVTITGASNVTCFTIEERLPVLATPMEIEGGGEWLPDARVVRWGPYTNVPDVTVSYRLSSPPGSYTVGGLAWADGRWKFEPPDSTVTISGETEQTVPTEPAQVATPVIAPLPLQAEAASAHGGVSFASTHSGFNGTGFAVFPSDGGVLEFTEVNGGVGGAASFSVRYALEATSPRAGRLVVDGVTRDLAFTPTSSWTHWSLLTQRITLAAGATNVLRLESTGDGLAHVDEITVSPDGPAVEAEVVLSCATPGAAIHYTLDGSLPSPASAVYTEPLRLVIPGTVRARAFFSGWWPSVASMANYAAPPTFGSATLVRSVETDRPWAPVMRLEFTPGAGAVCQALEERVPGALVVSNVSGGGVATRGVIRWGPFLDANAQAFSYQATGPAGSYSVQARWSRDGAGVDLGGTNLIVASADGGWVVPVEPPRLPGPVLEPPSSAALPITVSMTHAVPTAEIRYTTNGTTPVASSPLYGGGLELTMPATLRARAFLAGWRPSDAVVGYYGSITDDPGPWLEVVRTIPSNAIASPFITLEAAPHGHLSAYSVTETVPLGLTPAEVTPDAVWNEANRTLKWGPFTNAATLMTYRVVGTPGAFVCSGQASGDGYPGPITGESNVLVAVSSELAVPAPPPKLPVPGLTPGRSADLPVTVTATCPVAEAALRYTLDGTVPTALSPAYADPLQFSAVATLRIRAFLPGWEASDAAVGYYQTSTSTTHLTVTRSLTDSPGYAPEVALTVTPAGNVSAFTVTESVPDGITPFGMAPSAVWNPTTRTLRWGPFASDVRLLAYQVSGLSGEYALDGSGSVDGVPVAIAGDTNVVVDLELMPGQAAPAITVQPLSQPTVVGADLVLYVEAVGAPDPGYQWRKDGLWINGANSPVFTRTNVQPADAGWYDVIAFNSVGAVTSHVAVVSLLAPPIIARQPLGQVLVLGSPAILEVLATSPSSLSYQWRKNGEAIPGAIGRIFAIPSAQLEDAGTYTVEISNEYGSVESEPASLTPTGLPLLELVDHFEDRRLFALDAFGGLTDNLAATAQRPAGEPLHAGKFGGASLWLTWRPSVSGVATFSTVGSGFDTLLAVYRGATLATLQEVASDEDRGGYFTSLLSFNAVGGLDYQIAVDGYAGDRGELILSWNLEPNRPPLPQISASPESRVVEEDSVVTLTVLSPTPGVIYRWFFNGQELAGETQATLTFTAAPARVGTYRARVTAASGAFLDSADALVEVVPRGIPASPDDQVSEDKWQDLFFDERLPTRAQLQGRPTRMGFTSVGLGLGGRYTEPSGASRSLADPSGCRGILGGSRWFRFQVDRSRRVRLSLESAELNATMTAYHAPPELPAVMECVRAEANGGPVTSQFLAVAGVDYLVMVAAAGGGRGRVLLTWEGEEELPIQFRQPILGWQEGRFHVVWPDLEPGVYELRMTDEQWQWQRVFQTNVTSGVIEYVEPEPPSRRARFYHLRVTHP